jgi:hypothetical protein
MKHPRYIIVKTLYIPNEERILKAARQKQHITYKGKAIRKIAYFSTETLKARDMERYSLIPEIK